MAWNDFAVQEVEPAIARLSHAAGDIAAAWNEAKKHMKRDATYDAIEEGIARLRDLPKADCRLGRGQTVPWWYVNMFNINLMETKDGYAVIETDDNGRVLLHTSTFSLLTHDDRHWGAGAEIGG